jgi:tRNA-dihydrouridine synthase C
VTEPLAFYEHRQFFSHEAPPRTVLAPMEGVVDAMTRSVLTSLGGVDLCLTEFVRVTTQLLPEHVFYKYAPELRSGSRTAAGTPLLIQLLGSDPVCLGENAARAVELGAYGIDLNFGCPAKTVNRHDGGASLLKNPERVANAVRGVRSALPSTVSVSAKVRLGFHDKSLHREIAQAAESGGADWLTVHARTRDEGYQPPAHWAFIASMRESIRIPVIANGECWTPADVMNMQRVSGCRHVMLGRGLLARPSLAREIRGGSELTWAETLDLLRNFYLESFDARGEAFASARLKQWLRFMAEGARPTSEISEGSSVHSMVDVGVTPSSRAQNLFERLKRLEPIRKIDFETLA